MIIATGATEVVEVEVEEVEVRCMLDDWEVTLVIIFPL